MLYLKSANLEDIEKEYEFITNTPSNENGFTNFASGCSRKEFEIKNAALTAFSLSFLDRPVFSATAAISSALFMMVILLLHVCVGICHFIESRTGLSLPCRFPAFLFRTDGLLCLLPEREHLRKRALFKRRTVVCGRGLHGGKPADEFFARGVCRLLGIDARKTCNLHGGVFYLSVQRTMALIFAESAMSFHVKKRRDCLKK